MSLKEFFKSVLKKLQSTKLWITFWAMFLVTYITIRGMSEFITLAYILASAPLVYCGINLGQDIIFNKKTN